MSEELLKAQLKASQDSAIRLQHTVDALRDEVGRLEAWNNRLTIECDGRARKQRILTAALKLAKDHAELEDEVLDIVDAAISESEPHQEHRNTNDA